MRPVCQQQLRGERMTSRSLQYRLRSQRSQRAAMVRHVLHVQTQSKSLASACSSRVSLTMPFATGCVTCKAKRLKCDETKPSCLQCRKRGVECGGYKKDFKWKTFEENSFIKGGGTKRRSSRSEVEWEDRIDNWRSFHSRVQQTRTNLFSFRRNQANFHPDAHRSIADARLCER